MIASKFKNIVITAALIGVVAVTLTGCAPTIDKNSPTASTSATPTPTIVAGVEPEPVACEETGPWGDVVARELYTDEYGDYCAVTIDPNSNALKYEIVDVAVDTLTEFGFTEEEAKIAQGVAVKTLVETSLDSTRLDNYSQNDTDWFAENKDVVAENAHELFTTSIAENGLRESALLITDALPEPVVRDGGPRAQQINISVVRIAATMDQTGETPVMVVRTTFSVVYDVSNEKIVETILKNDNTVTEESLRASNPELFETTGSGLLLQGTYVLGFNQGQPEKISAIANKWTLTAGEQSYLVASRG